MKSIYQHKNVHQLTLHFAQRQHTDGLQSGQSPREQMEQMRSVLDGLVSPLQSGRQEPGECQARPPGKRGHAAKVQCHKENGARSRLAWTLHGVKKVID